MLFFCSSQLNVALSKTHWPHSTTRNTRTKCHCLATKFWRRIAPMSWNSWFCWRRITLNRTTSMWKLLTCECPFKNNNRETLFFHLQADRTKQHFNLCTSSDIDLYPKNTDVIVKVNGMAIPINNLPYQHPTGFYTHQSHHQILYCCSNMQFDTANYPSSYQRCYIIFV